ncbi:MAG: type II toxin-antitoxin system RelE/ParE family toxin [Chthoniobacterales bacterium]
MRLVVLDQAAREFAESVAYYEAKESDLGWRFRNEVVEAVARIERNPELPRLRPRGYRRHNLHAFPHYIAYVIRDGIIWVVAIAHAHRRPEFWLGRI